MNNSVTEIVGREVRAAMVRKGWNIQDLAGNLEISPPTLSRYLRGDRDFPASTLIAALRMLDVEFGDFAKRVETEVTRSINEAVASSGLSAS